MLGLPDEIKACLFDMDGVVTKTALVHAAAWKEMFDEFLRDWSAKNGTQFVPFDSQHDYNEYVDGKPRLEGIKSFLESRNITLPLGTPSDPPGTPTISGLGNRKNDLFRTVLHRDGVEARRPRHRGRRFRRRPRRSRRRARRPVRLRGRSRPDRARARGRTAQARRRHSGERPGRPALAGGPP